MTAYNYLPTSAQYASARASAQRGGRIAYDALDFGVAAKNTYGQDGLGSVRNGSVAVTKYKKLKEDVGFKTGTSEERAFSMVGDVASVSGMVISAIALPKLAQHTVTSFRELTATIHDPNATTDMRLNKLEDTARAGAGTIFSTQGVVLGAKATADIMSRNRGMAEVLSKVGDSKITRFIASPGGKILNVLLPVADGAVFIGEIIATRRTFSDPNATTAKKFREVLNLGLATLKVSFWLLPNVAVLREVYTFASFGQLGLSLWDFQKTMGPHFKQAMVKAGWAVGHPVEALGGMATAVATGVAKTAKGVAGAVGWLFDEVIHPVRTAQRFSSEVSAWYNAYLGTTGKQIVGYVWPPYTVGNTPAGVTPPGSRVATPYVPGAIAPAGIPGQNAMFLAQPAPIRPAGAGQVAMAQLPAVPAAPPPLPAAPPPPPPAPLPPPVLPGFNGVPPAPQGVPFAGAAPVASAPVPPTPVAPTPVAPQQGAFQLDLGLR
jgi:hypothetical protein